jgi:signal peptidase I
MIHSRLVCAPGRHEHHRDSGLDDDMETDATSRGVPGWVRRALIGRRPKRTLARIAVLVALVFLVRQYVIAPIRVIGSSMLPTYQDRGVNFVNRLAYLRSEPKRGDVVAIRTSGESIMFMKRIIGLPGETVAFHNGRVFVNHAPLKESYIDFVKFPCDWEVPQLTLERDQYYVVGDNRTMPEWQHEFGTPHRVRIVGKVLLCKNLFASSSFWP